MPWRPSPDRLPLWDWVRARWSAEFPDWPILTGGCPDDAWSKGTAVADALTRTSARTVIVADADVWTPGISAAVDEVLAGRARWAMPHALVRRLTPDATLAVLDGAPLDGQPTVETHQGMPGGGLVVVARDVLDGVPMDPAFTGWGQEDSAWALALTTLAGPMWRGTADLTHLWHPPAPRRSRSVGSLPSLTRFRRYVAASGRPDEMRRLVAEFCPTPLEGSPTVYSYRNANTGDEVEYEQPNARLEMLPNWTRIAAPEPTSEPTTQSTIGRPPVSEPKAAWVEYATSLAQDSDEAAEILTLTKADLIDRYGKEN